MGLKGKRVLVLGLGDTGMSMARWLTSRGAIVRVADSRESPPHAPRLAQELPGVMLDAGTFRAASFEGVDVIAISPGVAQSEPLVRQARERGVPVVGDIELFAQAKGSESAVIAITGSNGKSTVTTMVGAMCEAAGASVVVAGNIGLPVLDALDVGPAPRFYALELSSFQLEATASLNPAAATVLNLSEDHLDRYDGMPGYAAAKARIFQGTGTQILNRDDAWSVGMRLPGRDVVTFGLGVPGAAGDWGIRVRDDENWLAQGERAVMPAAEISVPGLHNAANALAALAMCRAVGLPEAPLLDALRRFHGLPHRMQAVAEKSGVVFYDDSKGTNVGATVAALTGLGRPCVLIAGGDGKSQDFQPLADPVARHARAVILIGRDREKIAAALAGTGVILVRAAGMDEAVQLAYGAARVGDGVLLSPACASYDMFRDYRHRGEEFARIARELAGAQGSSH
jgi:UDP-N-acetylmuramoylalanine--D-glutamate ligase